MNTLALAIIVIIGIVVVLALFKNKAGSQGFPYQLSTHLLSNAERSFYGVLVQAVGSNGLVFSKVRVADVISPRMGLNRSDWQRAFNAVSAKHFDFLVCDPQDCSVRFAVELDDVSHTSCKGQKRDRLLNSACDSAGLPLIRVKAAKGYVVADIRAQVELALSPPEEALKAPDSAAPVAPEVERVLANERQRSTASFEPKPNKSNRALASRAQPAVAPPQCPKCGEPMLRRQ